MYIPGSGCYVSAHITSQLSVECPRPITSNLGGCSGNLVAKNVVITAGHCLFHYRKYGFGSWAKRTYMRIYPGRNGNSTPYGYCTVDNIFAPYAYTLYGWENYDYGIIKLNCSIGSEVDWLGHT